jgi:hypothetical protein
MAINMGIESLIIAVFGSPNSVFTPLVSRFRELDSLFTYFPFGELFADQRTGAASKSMVVRSRASVKPDETQKAADGD